MSLKRRRVHGVFRYILPHIVFTECVNVRAKVSECVRATEKVSMHCLEKGWCVVATGTSVLAIFHAAIQSLEAFAPMLPRLRPTWRGKKGRHRTAQSKACPLPPRKMEDINHSHEQGIIVCLGGGCDPALPRRTEHGDCPGSASLNHRMLTGKGRSTN